jgi:spore coat protein U domain-containing protein, fimbrial subunit CupE1/2/3/6
MLKSKNCQNWPKHLTVNCSAAVIGLLGITAAFAWTGPSTPASQVTPAATCTISASTVNFGSQGLLGANVDQTVPIQVMCTKATPYSIGLDAGIGPGATVAARKMTGAATVIYSLYSDSALSTVWGNTIGADTVAAIASGSRQNHTVYGRMLSQNAPALGTYTDMITVTVTY